MKPSRSLPALLLFALLAALHAQDIQIDWQKAQSLHNRATRGEKLSPDDQKYYEEALRQRAKNGGQNPNTPQRPQSQPPPPAPKNLVPLTELKTDYHGQDGGLYGGGKNDPPADLAARAQTALAQIRPLNTEGQPANDGKIALMSIGMSNTTQEFSTFKRLADNDPRKSPSTILVDGAQGGQTAQVWATIDRPWDEAARRVQAAGLTSAQVQVLWIKQANGGPSAGFPAETDRLRDDVRKIIDRAREKYPNVRLIFLSSRIYAGYATTRLNPEPYAYEGAFAMRAVVREQAADGPAILWGPYLWTNGAQGRASDDFQWLPEDCGSDGTHPSPAGQEKVARLLLDFFTKNPYAQRWFVRGS